MRFAIICLMSLLLVPALGSEQQHRPGSSPPPPYQGHPPPYREHPPPYLKYTPPPPEQRTPPRRGNFVYYHGSNGPHAGIVLASQPDRQGHYPLAPLIHPTHFPITVHTDKVVKVHPGDIVTNKGISVPHTAARLRQGHAENEPHVSYALGPLRGSPNYKAEHGGSFMTRLRGGRGRN